MPVADSDNGDDDDDDDDDDDNLIAFSRYKIDVLDLKFMQRQPQPPRLVTAVLRVALPLILTSLRTPLQVAAIRLIFVRVPGVGIRIRIVLYIHNFRLCYTSLGLGIK